MQFNRKSINKNLSKTLEEIQRTLNKKKHKNKNKNKNNRNTTSNNINDKNHVQRANRIPKTTAPAPPSTTISMKTTNWSAYRPGSGLVKIQFIVGHSKYRISESHGYANLIRKKKADPNGRVI